MKLVIDSNILISALIKDSITRTIIMESGWEFYYPDISLREIRKYKDLVLEKSELNGLEFEKLLENLLSYITLVPTEQIMTKLDEAKREMEHVDLDDVVCLGLALSMDSEIWSDDSDFEKQNKIKTWKTEKVVEFYRALDLSD